MTADSALDAALDYASRGWPVFPCTPRKVPLVKAYAETATTKPEQLFAWWHEWPWALIALPTGTPSGFVILDIDTKNGVWGFDTLSDLGLAILPDTPLSHTRSGGTHVWFACHPKVDIRNSIGEHGFGAGVDVRGTGGLILLPCIQAGYSWDPHFNFDTCTPVPAPAWLGYRRRPPKPNLTGQPHPFDAETILEEACDTIRRATIGDKWRTIRREAFIVGCLVRDRLVSENRARHELDAAVLGLKHHCKDFNHAIKGYHSAFAEGRAAPRRVRT